MKLDSERIQKFLHQRYPFLMIDKIIDCEKEKRAVGIKNISYNEPFFVGHFPSEKIMPGALIAEAMAQTAIFLFYDEFATAPLYYLTNIKSRFLSPVCPGDQMRIEATPVKIVKDSGIVKTEVFVKDKKIASGEFVFKAKT